MQPLWVYAAELEGDALADVVAPVGRLVRVGVGKALASSRLTRAVLEHRPPWVLGFGLCGAYPAEHRPVDRSLAIGDLCVVQHETFADEGALESSGFRDLGAMGLGNVGPFDADSGLVDAVSAALGHAAVVRGATVSTCSAADDASRQMAHRTGADVETMEGAAIAVVCRELGVPWVQVRCVSNRTGDRDRSGWDLEGSIVALHDAVRGLVVALQGNSWSTAR